MTAPNHPLREIVLEGELGRGGFSRVHRACLPPWGNVAVKCVGSLLASSQTYQEELRLEGQFGLGLQHPNIVRTLNVEEALLRAPAEEVSGVCVVRELVEGISVRQLMRTGASSSVSPLSAAWVLHELLRALVYLDERGAGPHCDVSPANLLLTFTGDVKLTDFGIASLCAHASCAHASDRAPWLRVATRYLAPEVAAGEVPAKTSDLYAAGVLLVELLDADQRWTARVPASHTDVARGLARPSTARIQQVAPQLAAFAEALCELAPSDRPAEPARALTLLNRACAEANLRLADGREDLARTLTAL